MSIPLIRFQPISIQPLIYNFNRQYYPSGLQFRRQIYLNSPKRDRNFVFKLCCSSENSDENGVKIEVDDILEERIPIKKEIVEVRNPIPEEIVEEEVEVKGRNPMGKLRETIGSLVPITFVMKKQITTPYAVGLCIAATFLVLSFLRAYLSNRSKSNTHGSVADLVKRGQLRSDRRGISKTLKYDDPFNNPMVKVSKSKSTVEMCGKVYRLAPVTLTEREQSSHQKRRSRAYQWKRPTMFLKEGDSIPPDVDPDTVRWIPANHPFATTVNDIDEDVAQSNVYQKNGVPFRIKAEHEALQKKLEALQNEQKLNKLGIDPGIAREFERPFKSFSSEQIDQRPPLSGNPKIDSNGDLSEKKRSDEAEKP